MTKQEAQCRWCGCELDVRIGPGRPRTFCSQACRQWDWVARHAHVGGDSEYVLVRREHVNELADRVADIALGISGADSRLHRGVSDLMETLAKVGAISGPRTPPVHPKAGDES